MCQQLPDLIWEQIFGHLGLQDLFSVRLLCQHWNLAAISVLKGRMDSIEVRMSPREPKYSDVLSRLFQLMAQNTNLSWENFVFQNYNFKSKVASGLLKKVGHKVTKLKLCYDSDQNSSMTPAIFGDILKKQVPVLKQLELSCLPSTLRSKAVFTPASAPVLELRRIAFILSDGTPYSDAFCLSLFKSSQKLTDLEIHGETYFMGETHTEILTSFSKHGKMENLTSLILSKVNGTIMDLLVDEFAQCPLKKFEVGSIDGTDDDDGYDPEVFEQFLEAHKDTLESLNFGMGNCILKKFPRMPKLSKLGIRVYCSSNNFLDFNLRRVSFDWGLQFANLVTLRLHDVGTKYADGFARCNFFPANATPCGTLKNLLVPPELSPEDFIAMGILFPNVLKLEVDTQSDDGVFMELWKNFPNLKTLMLSTYFMDIEIGGGGGFRNESTGSSEDESSSESDEDEDEEEDEEEEYSESRLKRQRQKLRRDHRSMDSMLTGILDKDLRSFKYEEEVKDFEPKRTLPSLLNFSKLNNLAFNTMGWGSKFLTPRSAISDFGLKFGLAKMTELKTVMILADAGKVTDDGTKYLSEVLSLNENHEFDYGLHLAKHDWQLKLVTASDVLKSSFADYL